MKLSNVRCIEPRKRMVGGVMGYAAHRFPIIGGISRLDILARSVQANNALLARLKASDSAARAERKDQS